MFDEKTPKTSHAKFSVEFNDFAVQTRPVLRLLDRAYTLLYVKRSLGRLGYSKHYRRGKFYSTAVYGRNLNNKIQPIQIYTNNSNSTGMTKNDDV